MEVVKERGWKAKFIEFPFLFRIVVAWVYLVSVAYFLKFIIVFLFQLSLDVFSLAFGYLTWVLASGLLDRSNLARIIALVWFGFVATSTVYVFLHGGIISFDGFDLTFLYPNSVIWLLVSVSSVLILLLPQTRRLFSNSNQEGKQ